MSQALCPVLATNQNNIITKDNIDSLLLSTYARTPGTRVTVSCYVPTSFSLSGPSQVTCNTNGQWSPGIPSCVRRSSNSGSGSNNNNNGAGITEDNNVSTTEENNDSILSDYSIIVIAVAAAFVVILIIILLVFLCKHFGNTQKNDDQLKEHIHIPHKMETLPRRQVAIVNVDRMFSSLLQDVYTGPMSPPSWHSHPIITMGDKYKHRTWSQLSVDQYVRDLDTSRRENPNHSWRDFATLSSHYSRSISSVA